MPADARASSGVQPTMCQHIMECEMHRKSVWRNIALMITFGAVAFVLFTENVRTVQILGLFACGAAFGASLAGIIVEFRERQKQV